MATNTSADTQTPPGNPNTRGCTLATSRNNGMYAADSTTTRATMPAAARPAGRRCPVPDTSLLPTPRASSIAALSATPNRHERVEALPSWGGGHPRRLT